MLLVKDWSKDLDLFLSKLSFLSSKVPPEDALKMGEEAIEVGLLFLNKLLGEIHFPHCVSDEAERE